MRLVRALPGLLRAPGRAHFFNIFNHPNFGSSINFVSSPEFGQPTQMLASSLGSGGQSGGLSPLYQIGGPSSIQLAPSSNSDEWEEPE